MVKNVQALGHLDALCDQTDAVKPPSTKDDLPVTKSERQKIQDTAGST